MPRRVLVTGGSRGIGRAVAEQFAAQGATLAVQFRAARQAADDTVAALPGAGHLALPADLADPGRCGRWSSRSSASWAGSTCW